MSVADVILAQGDPTPDGTAVLVASLGADDHVVVAEAADGLVARRAVEAIPSLARIDVLARPGAAPSVIDALGRLAAVAPTDLRGEAVMRLLELLREEKRRGAPESAGNLLQIYEALGHTRDQRAAPALEEELADPAAGKAPRVVVVQALVSIAAPSSRGVAMKARAELAASPEAEVFEAELRQELLLALDDAIARLP